MAVDLDTLVDTDLHEFHAKGHFSLHNLCAYGIKMKFFSNAVKGLMLGENWTAILCLCVPVAHWKIQVSIFSGECGVL